MKQCEFVYGDFDKALGIIREWTDETGRCTQTAHEKWKGAWYCPVHLDLVMEAEDNEG